MECDCTKRVAESHNRVAESDWEPHRSGRESQGSAVPQQ
jgi:hypothetical protein